MSQVVALLLVCTASPCTIQANQVSAMVCGGWQIKAQARQWVRSFRQRLPEGQHVMMAEFPHQRAPEGCPAPEDVAEAVERAVLRGIQEAQR